MFLIFFKARLEFNLKLLTSVLDGDSLSNYYFLSFVALVLKSARRSEANRVPKREAQGEVARIMDARLSSTQNFLKVFNIPQIIFCINKLDKCIKKVIKINITTKTTSNLRTCVVLS